MTKLALKTGNKNIPAWLLEGIEAFCIKTEKGEIEKWVVVDRQAMPFEKSPIKIQNAFGRLFDADKRGQMFLKKMGLTTFREGFNQWYFCLFGGLDSVPDIINGELVPDAYNSSCTDIECEFRGRFCSRGTGLRNYEVATLNQLKQGKTMKEAADVLCISLPGMKSRVEKLKEKLEVPNMAALVSRATELGI